MANIIEEFGGDLGKAGQRLGGGFASLGISVGETLRQIGGGLGLLDISKKEEKESLKLPLLKPVQPPKRRRRRSADPFDFFGTLFTTPDTSGLNASSFNQIV